ncbi:MAG: tetratricopeptide repeat protein [Candidatus Omnitrophota bacterium]
MPAEKNAYVLEVARQPGILIMGIFNSGSLSPTLKHYSQIPVSFPQINRLCREITSILGESGKFRCEPEQLNRMQKAGQFLWDHLLTSQVKSRLRNAEGRELILSLDEDLIGIPWELLYDGNDFLCLKFNLGRLVKTQQQEKVVQYRSSVSNVLKMLVLADPTADLKSAYLEGVHIRNQFDRLRQQVRIDFKSTDIDTVYVKKNLRDYDIVHFAGHCEYGSGGHAAGGWLLSDGRFTAQDILALGENQNLSLPGLIFSNACSSAKSSNGLMNDDYQEKTYSLAAAFLFSGVRHYIGTIWQIEDPVSLMFAKEFYDRLIKGASIGECIRLSRQRLVKEYGPAAVCWAGYILYGDPAFRLFKQKMPAQAPAKIRKAIRSSKSRILKLAVIALFIGAGAYLYSILPFRNPASYPLYLRANKLFEKGGNAEIIALSRKIIKNDPMFLPAYSLLANTYQRMGERENALKYYFDYALYSQKRGDWKNLSEAYIGIGWIHHLFGDYPKAFEFYNKAISTSKGAKDRLNEASGLRKLAVWYIDKEDYDKALELLTKSAEINRENQSDRRYRYNLACDYFDLGLVFSNKNDYSAAREFYQKSLQIFEKMDLKSELSDYYFNLGEMHLLEKQYSQAMECYLKGLKIDESHGNRLAFASDYNMIGELYMKMGNLQEAEKYFDKAVAVSKEISLMPDLAGAYYNLGLLEKSKNRKAAAKEYFRQAQEIYRRIDTPAHENIRKEFIDLENS